MSHIFIDFSSTNTNYGHITFFVDHLIMWHCSTMKSIKIGAQPKIWSNHCMQIKLFYRTYLSSRMSNFCTTSGNGASFRRVFSTSSQVSVEFSTSRLPNNSNTFPPNVLSQACRSLPEQAAFTDSTEYGVIFINVIVIFIEFTDYFLYMLLPSSFVHAMN